MNAELSTQKCTPCEGNVQPLESLAAKEFLKKLSNGWYFNSSNHLENVMHFVNFRHTMNMVNKIAAIAESEGHHPDLHISYAKLTIEIWTHAVNGLSENDFILAAKIDKI
jgi:4a-hydroxytetrahydrobiopterin dehydratase